MCLIYAAKTKSVSDWGMFLPILRKLYKSSRNAAQQAIHAAQ